MLLLILLVMVLLLVQSVLPGHLLARQVGPAAQMGPRDDLPEPSKELKRANNALRNFQETLPIFLTLAVLSIVFGEQGWISLAGGALYLVGRIAHFGCYLRGLSPWRSIAYTVAILGTLMMAGPLIGHLWD